MSLKLKLKNDWGRLDMKSELSTLCFYAKGKVSVDTLSKRNYVSTENMLPNMRDTLLPKLMSGELDVSDIDL